VKCDIWQRWGGGTCMVDNIEIGLMHLDPLLRLCDNFDSVMRLGTLFVLE
jgi:hypothetical protein